ncbi:DMT family transporter [Psychrobacillus antarcticus]|uniref:DMT family transporter n=1 Tax=Psychrobacillus antarcticus TaxID=2879115 RepID=UPI002407DB67|nr:DMT family transporter [Psychrobacillus antarcticus]
MKNNIFLGAFLCFIASVSWGAMFPVAHHAFTYIDPFYFTLFRYGAVTIILVVLLLWKEGFKAFRMEGKGKLLWFFGTMAFTVYNLLIFWGEDLLGEPGVMVASIMESLMPMISIIIVWFFYRHRPYSFTLLCVIVSFVGAILVITKGDIGSFLSATNNIIPSLLILIAVIGWVIYTMGGDKFRGWSVLRYSTLSCLLGTISAAVIVAIATMVGYVSIPTFDTIQTVSPHLLFMIIFPGVIALVGWNVGVSILTPLNALLFINFVPVTTLVISSVQGTHITIFEIIGVTLIILSLLSNNIFVRLVQKKETRQRAKQSLQESIS